MLNWSRAGRKGDAEASREPAEGGGRVAAAGGLDLQQRGHRDGGAGSILLELKNQAGVGGGPHGGARKQDGGHLGQGCRGWRRPSAIATARGKKPKTFSRYASNRRCPRVRGSLLLAEQTAEVDGADAAPAGKRRPPAASRHSQDRRKREPLLRVSALDIQSSVGAQDGRRGRRRNRHGQMLRVRAGIAGRPEVLHEVRASARGEPAAAGGASLLEVRRGSNQANQVLRPVRSAFGGPCAPRAKRNSGPSSESPCGPARRSASRDSAAPTAAATASARDVSSARRPASRCHAAPGKRASLLEVRRGSNQANQVLRPVRSAFGGPCAARARRNSGPSSENSCGPACRSASHDSATAGLCPPSSLRHSAAPAHAFAAGSPGGKHGPHRGDLRGRSRTGGRRLFWL